MVDCISKGVDGLYSNIKFPGIKFHYEKKRSSLHKEEES